MASAFGGSPTAIRRTQIHIEGSSLTHALFENCAFLLTAMHVIVVNFEIPPLSRSAFVEGLEDLTLKQIAIFNQYVTTTHYRHETNRFWLLDEPKRYDY
jgi:hypothetical protein